MKWKNMSRVSDWIKENQGKYFCRCGCGEPIKILFHHHFVSRGIPQYVKGHCNKKENHPMFKGGLPRCRVCGVKLSSYGLVYCRKCMGMVYSGKNSWNYGGDKCVLCGDKREENSNRLLCKYHLSAHYYWKNYLKRNGLNVSKKYRKELVIMYGFFLKTREVLNESRGNFKGNEVRCLSGNS